MDLVVVLLLLTPIAVVAAVARNQRLLAAARARTDEMRVDQFGIYRRLADGREERVDWSEITGIEVYRTDRGPHRDAGGVVMIAGDDSRGCLVPLTDLGTEGLVEGLSRLPGFRVEELLAAADAPAPSTHRIWPD